MNAAELAKTVVYWLEYERLCGREKLFVEAALKTPIHHYLTATEAADVFLEEEFPGLPRGLQHLPGRKKSLDFCLRRRGGGRTFLDVIESKFINDKRSFAQELLDDLYRLRWMKLRNQSQACQRWLLVAGRWEDLKQQVLNKGSTIRKPVTDTCLYGVLHRESGKLHTFDIKNSSEKHRNRWTKAADQLLQTNLPSKFKTKLEAIYPPANQNDLDFVSIIWRVIKPARKRHN